MNAPEQMSESILTNSNAISFDYKNIGEAFPEVEPGMKPFGHLGLFQIRRPKKFSAGGLELPADARATEYYNTQVAKVIALGALCFKTVRNVGDGEEIFDWPEGPWFQPGDFVRVPKYGGDRYSIKAKVIEHQPLIGSKGSAEVEIEDEIIFALFKVKDVQGVITCDPRVIKAYLD